MALIPGVFLASSSRGMAGAAYHGSFHALNGAMMSEAYRSTLGSRVVRSAGPEPVFQPADGPPGERPGGWAEQGVKQPHPRQAQAAKEGEPGAACHGDGGHTTD